MNSEEVAALALSACILEKLRVSPNCRRILNERVIPQLWSIIESDMGQVEEVRSRAMATVKKLEVFGSDEVGKN